MADEINGSIVSIKKESDNYITLQTSDFATTLTLFCEAENNFILQKDGTLYRKLPDSKNDYLNRFLAGTYQDDAGNEYIFTNERKAIFPDITFDYILFDEYYWPECNMILQKDESGRPTYMVNYGYRFIDNQLYLYHIELAEPFGYDIKECFTILHKIND